MIQKIVIPCSCFLLFLVGCKSEQRAERNFESKKITVDYFADNGFGNAVAVVQHPAGIYHDSVTYVCYQGPQEDPYVASYDHTTKEWKGPFKAGVSKMGKDPSRLKKIDNHGKPSMIIDDAGYIHIAYGGHGGMRKYGENPLGNTHYGKNLHAVSKKPLDISSWETLDNIPPFGTYNQFVKMENGDIYLFYRHGAHRSDWVYQKSTDNGRSFNDPVSFLKHKRRTDQAAEDSWYPWVARGKGNDIIVAFDYHLCSDRNATGNVYGHIPKRYNVYYMVFDTQSGLWSNAAGEQLTMPLTREEANKKTLVTETEGQWTFQAVADLDETGKPHLGVTIGPDEGKRSGPKSMHYFSWDGAAWVTNKNGGLPVGNGDLMAESPQEIHFYLESSTPNNVGEVSRWVSINGGRTFDQKTVFLSRRNSGFNISSLIENPHPDAQLIVAEKEKGTSYRKMYLLGENGPVPRKK